MPQPSGGVLFMDSPQSQGGTAKWSAFGKNLAAGAGPLGENVYSATFNNALLARQTFTPTASVLASCSFMLNNLAALDASGTASGGIVQFWGDNFGTRHLSIGVTNTGEVVLKRPLLNGTVLATSATGVVVVDTWHHFQARATIADAGGRGEIWIDGVKVIDFTGDTKNAGTATDIDSVLFGIPTSGAGATLYHTDIMICDSTTPIGIVRVHPLFPVGAGNSTNMTPGGGSGANWERTDETPPDGDTSYVFSGTQGVKDLYEMSNLPSGDWDVLAVQANVDARRFDAGAKFVRPVIRTGGVDYPGASASLAETYVTTWQVWDDSPNTSSPWTQTNINAVQVGAEVRDS